MCGISYPQASPLASLNICCTSVIQVYDDCFQYCPASGRESTIFSSCVQSQVGEVDETGFQVICNGGTKVPQVEAEGEKNGADVLRGKGKGWKVLVGTVVVGIVGFGWGGGILM